MRCLRLQRSVCLVRHRLLPQLHRQVPEVFLLSGMFPVQPDHSNLHSLHEWIFPRFLQHLPTVFSHICLLFCVQCIPVSAMSEWIVSVIFNESVCSMFFTFFILHLLQLLSMSSVLVWILPALQWFLPVVHSQWMRTVLCQRIGVSVL